MAQLEKRLADCYSRIVPLDESRGRIEAEMTGLKARLDQLNASFEETTGKLGAERAGLSSVLFDSLIDGAKRLSQRDYLLSGHIDARLIDNDIQSPAPKPFDLFDPETTANDQEIVAIYETSHAPIVRQNLRQAYDVAKAREDLRRAASEPIDLSVVVNKGSKGIEIYVPVLYERREEGLQRDVMAVIANAILAVGVESDLPVECHGLARVDILSAGDDQSRRAFYQLLATPPQGFAEKKILYSLVDVDAIAEAARKRTASRADQPGEPSTPKHEIPRSGEKGKWRRAKKGSEESSLEAAIASKDPVVKDLDSITPPFAGKRIHRGRDDYILLDTLPARFGYSSSYFVQGQVGNLLRLRDVNVDGKVRRGVLEWEAVRVLQQLGKPDSLLPMSTALDTYVSMARALSGLVNLRLRAYKDYVADLKTEIQTGGLLVFLDGSQKKSVMSVASKALHEFAVDSLARLVQIDPAEDFSLETAGAILGLSDGYLPGLKKKEDGRVKGSDLKEFITTHVFKGGRWMKAPKLR